MAKDTSYEVTLDKEIRLRVNFTRDRHEIISAPKNTFFRTNRGGNATDFARIRL